MIDPDARAAPVPIADMPVAWACACGQVSWAHHECCDRCGTSRPAPAAMPEQAPSQIGIKVMLPGGTVRIVPCA